MKRALAIVCLLLPLTSCGQSKKVLMDRMLELCQDASGEIVKYLESEDDLREYVPDFKERAETFYAKYGK